MLSQPRWSEPSSGYDGADEIESALRDSLRPDPVLTVSQWSDRFRFLSTKLAAEAGRYRTARVPFMRDVMDALSPSHSARRVVFMKAAQVGAPLALDTEIATPSGWTTMGAVAAGDYVFDAVGKPVLVDGVSEVFEGHDCYEVEFSDGAVIVADASHLWTVDDDLSRAVKERTLTTAEMAGHGRVGNRSLHYKVRGVRNRYAVPLSQPLDLPEAALPMAPYTFGVWLGDGNSASNQVTTHKDDAEEMAGYMTAEGHKTLVRHPEWIEGDCRNLIIEPRQKRGDVCCRGHDMLVTGSAVTNGKRVCSECNRQHAMHYKYGKPRDPVIEERGPYTTLKNLGVIRNKHIPVLYLRASAEQRLSLLQGLMDTDGSVDHRGRCELTIADELLSDGCVELIRSLGYKPTTSRRLTNEYVKGRKVKVRKLHTRISFMAYAERPVFRMRRKLAKLVGQEGKRTSETFRRRIVDIRPTASVPTRCISVASSRHLFLAGRAMVATHNTEAGSNWLGYIIHWSPAPVMAIWPTVETAKKNSKQRIEPLIEDCPDLAKLVGSARSRDSDNTQLMKGFPGGVLVMTGANSGVGLRSTPARYAFCDEIDAYPGDVDGEGDPIALIANRTTTFGRASKMFLVSTPTTHGESRIEREYEDSDQRRYFVPCPHCGEMQFLKFERLRWEPTRPQTARYYCEGCEEPIEERFKTQMMSAEAGAEWRPTAEPKDPGCVGFHISGLYSPLGWLSWPDLAREWEGAQGDVSKLKAYKNTRLGETWFEQGDKVDWERVYNRRERWKNEVLPRGVTLLLGAVDIQASPARLELHVWGFGEGLESWAIAHYDFLGSADDPKTWVGLEEKLEETWHHVSGAELKLDMVAVDTGDQTTAAYTWIAKQDQARVVAVKGRRGFDINAPVATPSFMTLGGHKKAVSLRSVMVDVFKAEFYRLLALKHPTDEEIADQGFPVGYVHVPDYVDAEWCKQLTAERRVRTKTGKYEWVKEHLRNEALDCRIYCRAAVWILGVAAWRPAKWAAIRERRGLDYEPTEEAPIKVRAVVVRPAAPNRRVVKSNYMG